MAQRLRAGSVDDPQPWGVCPVCGSANVRPTGRTYTPDQAAGQFCPAHRDAVRNAALRETIRALWGGGDASMRLCDACGFGYPVPHVSGDEDFYSLLHEDISYPANRWEFSVVREELRSDPGSSTILDWGAGDGAFLGSLPSSWDKYAAEASFAMRRALTERGIKVVSPMDDGTSTDSSFDVITMFQLLEHVADFPATLQRCRRLVRPGGRLYVSVPNGGTLRQWESAIGLPDMPPFHVNQWTPDSLGLALHHEGFEDVRWRCDPRSVGNLAAVITGVLSAESTRKSTLAARMLAVDDRRRRRALFALTAPLYAPRLLHALLAVPGWGAGVNLLAAAVKRSG